MSWMKVYAHDENGAATFGTLGALMDAIREGRQVRLLIRYPQAPDQEFYVSAEHLWIRHGAVFAQNTAGVSASFAGTGLHFQADPYHGFIIASTRGTLEQSRWLVGEHTSKGHTQIPVAVTWFVG